MLFVKKGEDCNIIVMMLLDTAVPVKAATSASADSMNSQLYGAISSADSVSAGVGGMESDDQEMYSEEDVLAGDIITTDEVIVL